MKKEYLSGIDLWLAVVLIGMPLTVVTIGAFLLTKAVGPGAIVISAGIVVGLLIKAFAIPCVYTLADESLTIKCGLLEEKVPLRAIRTVERSASAWSAPALSLKRVKITLDNGWRLISPKDRDGFIADLNARLGREGS